ncbi:unnamed protein product [Vitrella brassicaformis CCMP3155]|uniref:HMG box domain-containing protein n=1 Tax=Vitrella brassicaformis (strain CCMP3155) TaxID=1169540 RepID=A0A0G4GSD0_VITBC|nr:unnamed protein product [Vitrella brassicaformis CCMP3155]|eukprot:CEM33331.1 unnamed protein product [Vitrella brassicaformis CCMP3155]
MDSSASIASEAAAAAVAAAASAALNHDPCEDLLCDVLFSLAAHACDVAKAVADKTGYKWTPPALQGERPRGPSQRQLDITSYSLWCNYMRTLLKVRHPGHQGPSKEELSELWAELPADEKAPWEKQALQTEGLTAREEVVPLQRPSKEMRASERAQEPHGFEKDDKEGAEGEEGDDERGGILKRIKTEKP